MRDFEPFDPATASRLWLIPSYLFTLGLAAGIWWIGGYDFGVHLAITSGEKFVEYRPRLTVVLVLLTGMLTTMLILFYRIFFHRGERYDLDRWFFLFTVALPLLAGLAEYAAVQYRLNANNYERCYATSGGERHYKPFHEEIVRQQNWLRGGGCRVGSWSEN